MATNKQQPTANELEQALRGLWQIVLDYDLQPVIEDKAQDIDSRDGGPANGEHEHVVDVFFGVKRALGIES